MQLMQTRCLGILSQLQTIWPSTQRCLGMRQQFLAVLRGKPWEFGRPTVSDPPEEMVRKIVWCNDIKSPAGKQPHNYGKSPTIMGNFLQIRYHFLTVD